MAMLRNVCGYFAKHPMLRKLVISTPVVRDLAWRYVAGDNLNAGLAVVRSLNARGIKATLNYVGTHVHSQTEAVAAADAAIEALRRLHQEGLEANYSVKLTQIGLDIDVGFCRAQLRRVLDLARQINGFVRVDMEEFPYVDTTLQLFEEMQSTYGSEHVGAVIQSYLRERGGDLERLVTAGARVRLVKGGYWEPAGVAFQKKSDIDRAFLKDAHCLLQRGQFPALASHDARFIDQARQYADSLGIDKRAFEFQMLYGVRPDLQDSLVRAGYTVRCYVPYGGQWYAYFLGCVRKSVGSFVACFT